MLELKNINVTFYKGTNNEKIALDDVSLKVEDGDFITIIGSNGAGKSTLLNTIFGRVIPNSGEVILNGKNITKKKVYKRAKEIGIVFQDPLKGTAPNMTIMENMLLALTKDVNKKSKEDITNLIESLDLGLEDRLNQPVGLLSGGQRQAITLLMATTNNPKLLLLDEHTAALDPKTALNIMNLTENVIKRNNLTTLMITHNIEQAIKYGNKLLLLSDGKIKKIIEGEEKKNLKIEDILKLYNNDLADSMIL